MEARLVADTVAESAPRLLLWYQHFAYAQLPIYTQQDADGLILDLRRNVEPWTNFLPDIVITNVVIICRQFSQLLVCQTSWLL